MKFVRYILFSCCTFLFPEIAGAQNEENERKWFYPDYLKTQYAGNIGFVSFGPGYQWWRQSAQTDILYGYVPYYKGNTTIHTLTVKNTFRLHEFHIINSYNLSPIIGFSVSFEPGENSYGRIPSKYPEGYYSPNNFYGCLSLGLKSKIAPKKEHYFSAFEPYAEINTLADYVFYNIVAREDKEKIIFSIALGFNLYF
jgi:hypothetical protein